jgi:rfaE bifunctional protein kinase chain/domain
LHTTVKLRLIGRQQQLLRADFESRPSPAVLEQQSARFERVMPAHGVVLFSDYGKGSLTHVAPMIAAARALGKPILVDPKGSDYRAYAGATVITPNRSEMQQVVGAWHSEQELADKAQNLRQQLGLHAVIVTRSEEGMSLFDADGASHVGAQAQEVFDVTGAGDTVIATLAVLVGAGLSLREAMPWANKAGGYVVGKLGTATVSHAELFGAAAPL